MRRSTRATRAMRRMRSRLVGKTWLGLGVRVGIRVKVGVTGWVRVRFGLRLGLERVREDRAEVCVEADRLKQVGQREEDHGEVELVPSTHEVLGAAVTDELDGRLEDEGGRAEEVESVQPHALGRTDL
eukprot:scaffold127189_cov36-Phaeocystis_antarctica.AAC.1